MFTPTVFNRTVDDAVRSIAKALEDLKAVARRRADELALLETKSEIARTELERADRISAKLAELLE